MRRRLVIFAAAATLLLLIGGLVVVWTLDSILKGLIERYGSAATQVAVHADSVTVSILRGSAAIDGLTVANPSGFSAANIFRLGTIQLEVELGTLGSNPLVIHAITIVAPEVHVELDQNGESNVDVIHHNLAQFRSSAVASSPGSPTLGLPAPGSPAAGMPPPTTTEAADAQRFLIEKLMIHGAQLTIDTSVLGGARRLVTLPNTEETGIGARSGGVTGGEVAAVVVRALVRDVAATVAAAKVERALEKSIGGEAGKAVGEGVGEAIRGVGRALNKLLGHRGE
jgi:uncharacterized protein involved in outer membrane biogenesis